MQYFLYNNDNGHDNNYSYLHSKHYSKILDWNHTICQFDIPSQLQYPCSHVLEHSYACIYRNKWNYWLAKKHSYFDTRQFYYSAPTLDIYKWHCHGVIERFCAKYVNMLDVIEPPDPGLDMYSFCSGCWWCFMWNLRIVMHGPFHSMSRIWSIPSAKPHISQKYTGKDKCIGGSSLSNVQEVKYEINSLKCV